MTGSLGARVAAIAQGLGQVEPIVRVVRETAAVAVIFRNRPRGEEVLLIKRAEREGDPWSGDVAFPGGRIEAEDSSFRGASVRETREEIGADLAANARFLGYMRPFQARRRRVTVVPSVFLAEHALSIERNGEVSSYLWVPLQELLEPGSRSTYSPRRGDLGRTFSSFNLQGYTVWGLTERILSSLVDSANAGTVQPTSRRTS